MSDFLSSAAPTRPSDGSVDLSAPRVCPGTIEPVVINAVGVGEYDASLGPIEACGGSGPSEAGRRSETEPAPNKVWVYSGCNVTVQVSPATTCTISTLVLFAGF